MSYDKEPVIAVGAVSLDGQRMTYSSCGPNSAQPKPDLVAPGAGINAACAGTPDCVTAMGGTSMAAPHVAGAIALVLSKCKKQPNKTFPNANQIRAALTKCTQGTQHRYRRFTPGSGFGLLDAAALFQELTKSDPTP